MDQPVKTSKGLPLQSLAQKIWKGHKKMPLIHYHMVMAVESRCILLVVITVNGNVCETCRSAMKTLSTMCCIVGNMVSL
jgi:hypothetical protein